MYGETQDWYIWRPSNKRTHEGPNVWRSTERSCTFHLAVTEVSYKLPRKPPNYEKEMEELQKIFRQLRTRMSVKLQFLQSQTIFKRTVEIWLKNRISVFTKTLTWWKSTTRTVRMYTFLLATVGAWNRMQWLPSTGGSPWNDLSSMNNAFFKCIFQFTIPQCELSANISAPKLALFV